MGGGRRTARDARRSRSTTKEQTVLWRPDPCGRIKDKAPLFAAGLSSSSSTASHFPVCFRRTSAGLAKFCSANPSGSLSFLHVHSTKYSAPFNTSAQPCSREARGYATQINRPDRSPLLLIPIRGKKPAHRFHRQERILAVESHRGQAARRSGRDMWRSSQSRVQRYNRAPDQIR